VDTGVRVLRRFARWGLLHGAVWGVTALLLVRLLPDGASHTGHGLPYDVVVGAGVGLVLGPLVGLLVGIVCLIATQLPRWLLDAPDYVAVAVVIAVAALVQGALGAADDTLLTLLTVGALALAAAADAALSAPALLYPAEVTPTPVRLSYAGRLSRLLPHR